MSNLTLDGSTSFIGTEFIKLLATGSSNLATEEYVDDAIEQGGGGNVDLSNYYTQNETDALLNNKLNVNNPQDIIGNLRLDPTNGNSKLIINAVSPPTATDDFYCNGTGHFNGSLRVSVLTSDGDVNADGCNADTFNSHITTNDIVFKHNDVEYMRFNATDDELQLSKNIDVGSSTLICKNFDSGLSDVVFNLNSNEFLRFQLSDNTVRVPNTKSFLSQNVFTDIVKPLAFGNDVSFQGQNDTDDGYEEYFKINSTTKALDFSKGISSIKCNEFNSNGDNDVVLKQNNIEFIRLKTNGNMEIKRLCSFISTLALDASGALSIFRNPSGGIERIDIKNNYGTGRHRFIIANNTILEMTTSLIQATRILQCDAGIKTNTINSIGDNDLVFQQNGGEYMRFDTSSSIVYINREARIRKLRMNQYINTNEYIDFALEPSGSIMRFFIGNNSSHNFEINNTNVILRREAEFTNGLKTNTINTNGDNNLSFQRNGSDYITFNTNKIELSKSLHLANELVIDAADKLTLRPSLEGGLNIFDIRNLHPVESNPMIRFRVGEGGGDTIVCEMRNEYLSMSRNVIIGAGYELQTNIIDTNGDNALSIQRNGATMLNCNTFTGGGETYELIDVQPGSRFSSYHLYTNRLVNRTASFDTFFEGSHADGSGHVEYMRWNYTAQQLDFNAPIDNTGIAITGNRIDTTVSDERLKKNINDIITDASKVIKNVNTKTFEYKDEKHGKGVQFGFVANDLLEELPDVFSKIVGQDKDGNYNINHIKLSVVLWKALQEQILKNEEKDYKIEHLEARLFEIEDIIKELKGKKTTKPKAKAKSKAKTENK